MLKSYVFVLSAAVTASAALAANVCVNHGGTGGCYSSIQTAVNHAAANDTIYVGPGTYSEGVVIGKPVSLLGAGAGSTTIDATGQSNGVLVDGYTHPGLKNVVVGGVTVENAQNEGILVVSANNVTIRDNSVINNDLNPGLFFTGATTGCPGQPVYETDETGDCGGAIHFIGVSHGTVSGNYITGNADGLLISDETAASDGNLVTGNTFLNNPLECGIVMASHPPVGHASFPFAPHFGVINNMITNNTSTGNGVEIGGAGVGIFSDGAGRGRVSGNVISHNTLTGNGLGGVSLHTHVGPSFGLPADDMSNNTITGNYIASNHQDLFDTATPGTGVGININSGDGGSPVNGTVITFNIILDESVDIAINTPGKVEIHDNNLLGAAIGVANVCAFDGATACGGFIDASRNYWGCPGGPGAGVTCSFIDPSFSATIVTKPSSPQPVANGHN